MTAINLSNFSSQLLEENFDPIEFLNQVFPTEASLAQLTNVSEQIDNELKTIDDEISESIRKSAKVGERSKEIVNQSKQMVEDVVNRINNLQSQAKDTEHVVEDVCGSIKKYDGAKNNLTNSITTLKRLQMASVAVNELEMMSNQKNYGECADRILALTTLMEFFKDFEKTEILDDINTRFDRLKRQIHNQLSGEFNTKLFGQTVDPSIAPACRAVDAFGESYRNEIIEMFCSRFLDGYEKSFQNCPLNEIDRRYNWLKQRIDFYVLEYSKIFPTHWRVPYNLTLYFCKRTRIQIRDQLARSRPSIKDFQNGFEHTAKFEHVIAETFGKEEVNEQGEHVFKLANEFLGVIGAAFAKHTDLYVAGEQAHMKKLILKAKEKISLRKAAIIDSDNKLLKSGVGLVQYIKSSIDKCGAFSVGSALFDLFPVLKDIMLEYIKMVKTVMPHKISSESDLYLMCIISNTSFYFCSIIDGLAGRIRKSVSEDQKPLVRVDDTKDTLTDYNKAILTQISRALCEETRQFLELISNRSFQNAPEKNAKLPENLTNYFQKTITHLKTWLCDDNFALLRTLFVPEWINVFFMSIFPESTQSKMPITFGGTEILSKTTNMVRDSMLAIFPTGNAVKMQLHKKIIEKDFELILNALKVFASPEDAMVPIYKELFSKSQSKEQFARILRAKGLPSGTELKILNQF
ncbi:Vacuolar protein sorting-associated protein 53 [Tritrichomonas musculus]|uniref:Vacuolar protein sorting-associated protein 53 n=1 Tax=Tritrichomonas musculus TaxID=1915356 RepID=A0ABR2GXG9_9EUKA